MNNFIELTFLSYPRIGYGDYTPVWWREYVNVDYIIAFKNDTDERMKSHKSKILIKMHESNETRWIYCKQSKKEIYDLIYGQGEIQTRND